MTCKECLHFDVCEDWHKRIQEQGFAIGEEIQICEDFKDKSRIIETPCKIGDTIYKDIFHKSGTGACVEYKVVGFHFGDFPKNRGIKRKQYFIVWHEVVNTISHLDFEQLGKTVFLTREAAEKAFKVKEGE